MTGPGSLPVPRDRSWMERAECRDQPAEWFTDPATSTRPHAMATCQQCPVRRPCLATALAHGPDVDTGIWGGTTEAQRRRIRTGALDLEEALTSPPPVEQAPEAVIDVCASPPSERSARAEVPRLPAPEVTVARNADGDYQSVDGRTIIVRLHRDPPWLLMVDDQPIARTETVTEARRAAWTTLHQATSTDIPRAEQTPVRARGR